MEIDKQTLDEFIRRYQKTFGEPISVESANERFLRLATVVKAILQTEKSVSIDTGIGPDTLEGYGIE